MYISTVRLYHPALWKISYSYRVVLVTMRVFENLSHLMFYCCLQGLPLIAWTRFPVTRGKRPPIWRSLAAVVAPIEGRASLAVGGGQPRIGQGTTIVSATSCRLSQWRQDAAATYEVRC